MKKKLFTFLFSAMLLTTSIGSANPTTVFAADKNQSTVSTVNKPSTIKPQISTWHYSSSGPLVGAEYQYNTLMSSYASSVNVSGTVLTAGIAGTTAAVMSKIRSDNTVGRFIAGAIFGVIAKNTWLNTSTLYYQQYVYGMDEDPYMNKQYIIYWYSDSAHNNYICSTTHYESFY